MRATVRATGEELSANRALCFALLVLMATFAVPFPRAAIEEPHEGVNAWHMSKMGSDVVGVWEVPLNDKVHRIEFEHGTTTGRRVVRLDGEVYICLSSLVAPCGNNT